MTKMKQPILILAFVALCFVTVNAQVKFEVPQNVELKVKEDYAKYEPAIVDAHKWLEATDLDKEVEKRKQVSAFAMQWVLGCPTIDIDLTEQLGKIYGKNDQLLLLYMLGYSREFIEHKTTATKFSATKAGLISIMNVYKKGIEITKSKEMDKLIKLTDENKLDAYIQSKFK